MVAEKASPALARFRGERYLNLETYRRNGKAVRIMDGPLADRADGLLDRKYGWQIRLLRLYGRLRRWRYTILAIRTNDPRMDANERE